MAIAVRFEGISKRYRLGLANGSLRSRLAEGVFKRNRHENAVLWALKNVSFAVEKGEAVGLIGPNGAGKSTLLRLIAGISQPTSGSLAVDGRVSSLLELGAGFHPELTGRENVFLYGTILGLSREELRSRFESIASFAEVEHFLDTPLKRYSSGMYVRLAFAVAAHAQPDILLVDEVLAVGDARYRQKCMDRMAEMRRGGTTLLFVSHNAHMVQSVCPRAIYLNRGEVQCDTLSADAIHAYESDLRRMNAEQPPARPDSAEIVGGGIDITDITVLDGRGQRSEQFDYRHGASIRVAYRAFAAVRSPVLVASLWRADGTACFTVRSNEGTEREPDAILSGDGSVALHLARLQLNGGTYRAQVHILDGSDTMILATAYSDWFQVAGPGRLEGEQWGVYVPDATWELPSDNTTHLQVGIAVSS